MARKKQVCTSIDPEFHGELQKLAEKERRSESEMAAILLENALKERERNRKRKCKDD